MARIVVAGEALIDLIVRPDGAVAAIPGGGPYNTARTIARLGGDVAFLGCVGTDTFGEWLQAGLADDGVDTRAVKRSPTPTTLAVAALDPDGSASYRFYLEGTAAADLADEDVAAATTPDVRALHVGTLGLAIEPAAGTIERLVGGVGRDVLVMLDPNSRPTAIGDGAAAFRQRIDRLAGRADVVKVSDDDLRFLAPTAPPATTVSRLLERGVRVVLRTDGPRAVEIRTAAERLIVEVPPVDVVDTVGAGDAFGGGFLASWLAAGHGRADLTRPDALTRAVGEAVLVASLTCTRAGADPPTRAELDEALGRASRP